MVFSALDVSMGEHPYHGEGSKVRSIKTQFDAHECAAAVMEAFAENLGVEAPSFDDGSLALAMKDAFTVADLRVEIDGETRPFVRSLYKLVKEGMSFDAIVSKLVSDNADRIHAQVKSATSMDRISSEHVAKQALLLCYARYTVGALGEVELIGSEKTMYKNVNYRSDEAGGDVSDFGNGQTHIQVKPCRYYYDASYKPDKDAGHLEKVVFDEDHDKGKTAKGAIYKGRPVLFTQFVGDTLYFSFSYNAVMNYVAIKKGWNAVDWHKGENAWENRAGLLME